MGGIFSCAAFLDIREKGICWGFCCLFNCGTAWLFMDHRAITRDSLSIKLVLGLEGQTKSPHFKFAFMLF